MNIDEGYVKYLSDWTRGPALPGGLISSLTEWRRALYQAGLIGHYPHLDVGYGNISIRGGDAGQFIISGTQTGHLKEAGPEHFALVTDYDIAGNRVSSTGPVPASSEALTHAAIYELDSGIQAVVHVHCEWLWQQYKHCMPTTATDVAYGTPEMAAEFVRLYRDSNFSSGGIAVMAGHAEGLVSIGATLEEAAMRMLRLHENSVQNKP